MGRLGQYGSNQEQTENPTSVYLDNIKGELGVWNKEKSMNDIHELDKFIILSIGFTVKGKVRDGSIEKYTNTYYSNEIRQFNETIYAIDMVFINGKAIKTLVAKGNWKTDVKPKMPQAVGIKAMITVLDLNDGIVKCFPVSASQYFGDDGLAKEIQSFDPTDILSYKITKMYTDGSKGKDGKETMITEKKLDEMKGSKASKYKNRYISTITKVSEGTQEAIKIAEELVDKVDEYYIAKKEFYEKTYGIINNAPAGEYVKLSTNEVQSDEDLKKEVEAEKETPIVKAVGKTETVNSSAEISVEDLPF